VACDTSGEAADGSRIQLNEGAAIQVEQLTPYPPDLIRSQEPLFGECRLAIERTLGGIEDFGYVDQVLDTEDGHLLVVDLLSPPFFKILERDSGEVVEEFGPKGEGPGEFQAPMSAFLSSREAGTVEIYDFSNQRISFVRLGQAEPSIVVREVPFRIQVGLVGLEPYGDRYVGVGWIGDHTLRVVDRSGRTVEKLVTNVPFEPEDTGGRAAFARQMNDARLGGAGSRMVVAYRAMSVLDLVEMDSRTYRRVVAPHPAETRFEVRDGGLFIDEQHELAYADVTATRRLVFGVFNGLTRAKRREAGPGGGTSRIIHVFDWEGRYLLKIELDRGITTLEVSPDHRLIWGGLADPYPLVGEWELPPIDEMFDRLDAGADPSELELCPAD